MLRLRDIMTTDVLTVTPETSLRAAMELFAARHVSGAPVVQGARVVGVLSATDIVAFASSAPGTPGERAVAADGGEWTEPGGWDADAESPPGHFSELWAELGDQQEADDDDGPRPSGWDPLGEYTVADAMTWGLHALPPSSDVIVAAECMRSADVHRMLVMEDGHLLGIVTTMDLVRAVAQHRIMRHTYVFDRPHGGA